MNNAFTVLYHVNVTFLHVLTNTLCFEINNTVIHSNKVTMDISDNTVVTVMIMTGLVTILHQGGILQDSVRRRKSCMKL